MTKVEHEISAVADLEGLERGTEVEALADAGREREPALGRVPLKHWYFIFFLVSGACSLVYEISWLRLASADFGITTPMVSIVLSVFMGGLGLGSWLGAIATRRCENLSGAQILRRYAALELAIGISGLVVVPILSWTRLISERVQNAAHLSSFGLYALAGILVSITLLPWCTAMGATVPFVMAAIGKTLGHESKRSFSFLYVANVLGALVGTLAPAFVFFELFGFERTLIGTALVNALLAATVLLVSWSAAVAPGTRSITTQHADSMGQPRIARSAVSLWLLFVTGFVTMALEVVWIRQFTPYLGTMVYAFALILASYLLGTFKGSRVYRHWNRSESPATGVRVWVLLGFCALIPLLTADPSVCEVLRFPLAQLVILLAIAVFSGMAGFVTPMLVDEWSEGDAERGGKAYGVNVLGCIVGPIASGFLLLPLIGVRGSTVVLAVPLFAAAILAVVSPETFAGGRKAGRVSMAGFVALVATCAVLLVTSTKGFAELFPQRVVKRDYTATVVATGSGMRKQLLVNGVGITSLTPITKMMAHLPLALLSHQPRSGLAICFGMGTTFRSMLSWGIDTTGVDLVPSVPAMFGYYFSDAPQLVKRPNAHIVIDDGRRFLERSEQRYDVIVIDPPPPVPAAGSSLLYSREFYTLAKAHLAPKGILAQWLPAGDVAVQASVAKAISESFPYVKVYESIEGWGWHFLASEQPIPDTPAEVAVSRMPRSAIADMLEWGPYRTPQLQFQAVLSRRIQIQSLIEKDPSIPPLSDNRPINEYFLLRDTLPRSWFGQLP